MQSRQGDAILIIRRPIDIIPFSTQKPNKWLSLGASSHAVVDPSYMFPSSTRNHWTPFHPMHDPSHFILAPPLSIPLLTVGPLTPFFELGCSRFDTIHCVSRVWRYWPFSRCGAHSVTWCGSAPKPCSAVQVKMSVLMLLGNQQPRM